MATHRIGNWYRLDNPDHHMKGAVYVLCIILKVVYAVNIQTGKRFGNGSRVSNRHAITEDEFSSSVDHVDGFTLVREAGED